jgi:hypothetical protein
VQAKAVGISLSAKTPADAAHAFNSESISGAGAKKIGFAGAFGLNLVRNETAADVAGGAQLDAGAGNLSLDAAGTTTNTAKATASVTTDEAKRGVGTPFAINVARNTVRSEVADDVLVRQQGTTSASGAADIAVKATSTQTSTTEAKGGAGSEDEAGAKAATPVFSIASIHNTTIARLGGDDLATNRASGNATVEAKHTATTTTKAEGSPVADETAAGISLAIGIGSDDVAASISGNWQFGGNVTIKADSTATTAVESKASVKGGQQEDEEDVDKQTDDAKKQATDLDGQAIDEEEPADLETPAGSLAVAGAAAVNVAIAKTRAFQEAGSDLTAGGDMSLSALAKVDAKAIADASTVALSLPEEPTEPPADGEEEEEPEVDHNSTGVGIAAAGNFAKVTTEATIEGNSSTSAASLKLDAGTAAESGQHLFKAESTSGIGVSKLGVAGSLAINFVRNDSSATIGFGASVDLDQPGGTADLTLTSRNKTKSDAEAKSTVEGRPSTGIGPSIAINVTRNTSTASLAESAAVAGTVGNYKVEAIGDYDANTESEAGTQSEFAPAEEGGDEGGLAISPSLAMTVAVNKTTAQSRGTQGLDVTGDLSVLATHTSDINSEAKSDVAAEKAAVGTSLALNVVVDSATAAASGSYDIAGKADVKATSNLNVDAFSEATASGARADSQPAESLEDQAKEYGKELLEEIKDTRSLKGSLQSTYNEVKGEIQSKLNQDVEAKGVAAAISGNVVVTTTDASVNGNVIVAGDVTIQSTAEVDVDAEATGLAAALSLQDGIGAAVAANVVDINTHASAAGQSLSGGNISILAGNASGDQYEVKSRALAGGGAKEDGKAGSFAANIVVGDTSATVVEGTNVSTTDDLEIGAQNDLRLQNIAGAGGIGQNDGFGGALALNVVRNDTAASLGGGSFANIGGSMTILAEGSVKPIEGDVEQDPLSLAVGGAAAGDSVRAGAIAINVIVDHTHAFIGENRQLTVNSTNPRVPGNLQIVATDATEIRSGAGAITLSTGKGKGLGAALNVVTKETLAFVGNNAAVTTTGTLTVVATATEDLFTIAAAPTLGGSGTTPSFAGAAAAHFHNTTTQARIGENASVSTRANTVVQANHTLEAEVIAGALSGGSTDAVGGSMATIFSADTTEALIGAGADVTVQGNSGLTVAAIGSETVKPLALGAVGAGSDGVAGSIVLTRLNQTTRAHVDADANIIGRNLTSPGTTRPNVKVEATNNTDLFSLAGVAQGAGTKGLGAALDTAFVTKQTQAWIAEGTTVDADGNVQVAATSSEDATSLAATAGGAGSRNIAGAAAAYVLDVTTHAILGDNPTDEVVPATPANIHAAGNVLVSATETTELDLITGAAEGAGQSSFGGAANVSTIKKETVALVADGTIVAADASDSVTALSPNTGKFGISFPTQSFGANEVRPPIINTANTDSTGDGVNDLTDQSIFRPRLVTPQTTSLRGVAVTATNQDDIATLAVGAAVSGNLAVNLTAPVNIVRTTTAARIGNGAQVNVNNQATAGQQSVLVAAGNDFSHLDISGSIAGSGSAAIGPAAAVTTVKNDASASIGAEADVRAKRDVSVQTEATEDALLIAASGAGAGQTAVAGSLNVLSLKNSTHAFIDDRANVAAEGNVLVSAKDTTDLDMIAGSAALGFGAGVSVSIGFTSIHKDTQAFIGNDATVSGKGNTTDLTGVLINSGNGGLTTGAMRGVAVQALSQEDIFSLGAAGSGGIGAAAVAGGINANLIDSDTTAFIGERAVVNPSTAGANSTQSVNVAAANQLDVLTIGGSAAVGANAIAGGIDIGVVRNDTTAVIAEDAVVNARQDIDVNAFANKDIRSIAISLGLSANVSVAGSVSVWSIGKQLDASYADEQSGSNALQESGDQSADGFAADQSGQGTSRLSLSLAEFDGVGEPTPVNPTPQQRIAEILSRAKGDLDAESPSGTSLLDDLRLSVPQVGTIARVESGATLTAGRGVDVHADEQITFSPLAGSLAGALTAAVGASVVVGNVGGITQAELDGTVSAGGDIDVIANQDVTTSGFSAAGQGGIVALGAAVVSLKDTSLQIARLGDDANIVQADSIDLDASRSLEITGRTGNAAGGVVAIGAAFSRVIVEGATRAQVSDGTQVGQVAGQTVGNLNVRARTSPLATAEATALSGGVVGGAINFSKAIVTPTVEASIGSQAKTTSGADVNVTGAVRVRSTSLSNANAKTLGVALGAGALGLGRATAEVSPTVVSLLGDNSQVAAAGDITFRATHNELIVISPPLGSDIITEQAGAVASAQSAAGGALSGNSTEAIAEANPVVLMTVGENATIAAGGLADIAATGTQKAQATGRALTVGLLLGMGGIESTASIAGRSATLVEDGASITGNSISIQALSDDRPIADVEAAAGGILTKGQNTATARVLRPRAIVDRVASFVPNASVTVNAADVTAAADLTISANELAEADAFAKGLAVGALAAGKSEAVVIVTPEVATTVNADATLTAGDELLVSTEFSPNRTGTVVARIIVEDSALAKDALSTAYAKGSGGGLIGLVGTEANSRVTPLVTTEVGNSVTANASNITVQSRNEVNAASVARNVAVGFIAAGSADARTTVDPTSRATIGGGTAVAPAQFTADQNFTLSAQASQQGDSYANSEAVAAIPIAKATAITLGEFTVESTVGDSAQITAGNNLFVTTSVDRAVLGFLTTTEATGGNAHATDGGFLADAFATATTRLGTSSTPALSQVEIEESAQLTAANVTLRSQVLGTRVRADSHAQALGVGVDVDSSATGEVFTKADVKLNDLSEVRGTSQVTIEARHGAGATGNVETNVESSADRDSLVGSVGAKATNRQVTTSIVEGLDGATVAARNLTVRANSGVANFATEAIENRIRDRDGSITEQLTPSRRIEWNADVILLGGPDAELVIENTGPTGATVTKAVGVTIADSDGQTLGPVASANIVVNAIQNTDPFGVVLFDAPTLNANGGTFNGVLTGNLSTFFVDRTKGVTIDNESPKNLQVGTINVISTQQPTVTISAANDGNFAFRVENQYEPTDVVIESSSGTGTPSITLTGTIENPVGQTEIANRRGSIVRTANGLVRTNTLVLEADNGSIGTAASRLRADLVKSNGRDTDLVAEAGGNVFLDLMGRMRQVPVGGQFIDVDVTSIQAGQTADVLLRQAVIETTPNNPPFLRVTETIQGINTNVIDRFRPNQEQFPVIDLGVLGVNPQPFTSIWQIDELAGANITIATNPAGGNGPLTSVFANTDVGASGIVNASATGFITLHETAGDLRVGLVTSVNDNVSLSSVAAIVDPLNETAVDVFGNHVTLTAGISVGTLTKPLDIDSNLLSADAATRINLVERNGELNVDHANASGPVQLAADKGSILDPFSDAGAEATGTDIILQSGGGGIGTLAKPLDINTAAIPGTKGELIAQSAQSMFITETQGALVVAEARSIAGNVQLQTTDTAAAGEDLLLGSTSVVAAQGTVDLRAGDNVSSKSGTLVQTGVNQATAAGLFVRGDFGNADPGVGTSIDLQGTWIGRPITILGAADADTIRLNQTVLQGPTNVLGGLGTDTILVDRIAPLTTTNSSGVRDALLLDGQIDNDQYVVNLTPNGNFIAVLGDNGRGTFDTLTVNGTDQNDSFLANPGQIAKLVNSGGTITGQLINFGAGADQLTVNAGAGNDVMGHDLATGNHDLSGGWTFNGDDGNDFANFTGTAAADAFEYEAFSPTSAAVRTQLPTGSQPATYNVNGTEAVVLNAANPTTVPGDTLKVVNPLAGTLPLPAGNAATPLPLTYTNFEGVTIGAVPLALADFVTTSEDTLVVFNPFANDAAMTDAPLTVTFKNPSNGTMAYNNNGTPNDLTDDSVTFTPPANDSGPSTIEYSVTDANGDRAVGLITVNIMPVADTPTASAANATGNEGTPIPLSLAAALTDTDGSETLSLAIVGVPSGATFSAGTNAGNGIWTFTPAQLTGLSITIPDDGIYNLSFQSTAVETANAAKKGVAIPFTLTVLNVAPTATIMTAPATRLPGESTTITMAATDLSSADQAAGFRYQVDWGDGSPIEMIAGTPGIGGVGNHAYAEIGVYTIRVRAIDKDDAIGPEITRSISVQLASLAVDPQNPNQTALFVQGTSGDDLIELKGRSKNQVEVVVNRVSAGMFDPSGRIVVYAGAGDDVVLTDDKVKSAVWLFGEAGRDRLTGGKQNDVLVGGDGDDVLDGGKGVNVVIGGRGADDLAAKKGEALLIAGTTAFDQNEAALDAILAEWSSGKSRAKRIEHLTGEKSGGKNAAYYLIGAGSSRTVFDDAALDRVSANKAKDWIFANLDAGVQDIVPTGAEVEDIDL